MPNTVNWSCTYRPQWAKDPDSIHEDLYYTNLWEVTNGVAVFKSDSEKHAEALCSLLNSCQLVSPVLTAPFEN